MTQEIKATTSDNIFADGGEMGKLMRSLDWSQTLLGPVSGWAQSLKTSISIILNSRYPMFIWWGANYANLYNDAYRPMLGATKHPQFLGKSARDCWADIWDVIGPLADSVLATGQPTWSEDLLLIMDRNGYEEETYFTFSYSPIRDESGGVGGVFCAVTETTERIIGERRLRTLRELGANTAQTKTVQQACEMATKTLSINPQDIPFALLYLTECEGKKAHLAGTTANIEAGTKLAPLDVDLEGELDNWHLTEAYQSKTPILVTHLSDRFGVVPGGIWPDSANSALVMPIAQSGLLIVGISPRRALNDDYRGFLDLVCNHLTAAIAQAQAYEAECQRASALAELDRAKTVFFSNISHEFRTPLTLMLGPLEDMLTDSSQRSDNDQNSLEMVHRNATRLLKLVNTLLDFSQIEAGRLSAVYEATDLALLTTDLTAVFRACIERAGLRLIVDCPPLKELLYVDRQMWEKIVLNLLSNAFKYTLSGEIKVNLGYCGDWVKLTVHDSGIGIPPQDIPRLFERFYRGQSTGGRTDEGSGIGLSLVQELVKLHGGRVEVKSIVNQGSCFTVLIPTGFAHLNSTQVKKTPALTFNPNNAKNYVQEALGWLPENRNIQTFDSEINLNTLILNSSAESKSASLPRILLADDNADMRDYIKRLLNPHYEVETVANGVEALAVIERDLPDLVLTDVMMPYLDGFELLRSLRANPKTQNIPIILLSARAGEESRVEGLEAGADDYLIKPFWARELLARVEANLKMAQLRQESARREQQLRLEAEEAKTEVINILESITDGFFSLDNQWRFTYINRESERLSQQKREELLGSSIWEVYPQLINSTFDEQLRRAVAEKISVHFETPSVHSGVWREVHAYPHQNGLAVYWRDITQCQQTEAALRQSETQFRQLADAMPQILWITNEVGEIEYLNQQWFDYTGFLQTENSYSQEQIAKAIHPDDIRITYQHWETALTTETSYHCQYRLRRGSDGVYRWFLGRTVPIKDNRGRIIKWYGTSTDIDDHKQAELKLQKNESLLNALIASSPIGIAFFDRDLRYVYLNEALAEINALPLNEHLGRKLAEVLPQIAPEFIAMFNQIMETREPVLNREFTGDITPGNFRHCLANHFPVCLPDGEMLGIGVTVMDITQLKQVESALRESEATALDRAEELETLMEITPVGLWIAHDPDCHTMSANQTAYKLMRAKPGDIPTATPSDGSYPLKFRQRKNGKIIDPQDLPMQRAASSGQEITDEIEFVFEDGTVRFIYGKAVPLRNELGNIRGVIGAFVDITERKQIEEALRQSEERYRYLAEAIPQLVWITNAQGRNEYVNQQMCNYTGLSFEQLLQSKWRKIVHPDDLDSTSQKWLEALENDGFYEVEYRLRNAQGNYQWHLGRAIPLKNEQGEIIKWFGTSTNIDTQKQLEAERERLLIRERAAREQAEEANRIKDEFLAVLSHELRSPLNPILGWAKMLQTQDFDAQTRLKGLSTIERNATLQAQLIEDLLDISRILRGKLSLNSVPVNLVFIIEAALETVRLAAEAKTINIETKFDQTVGKVLGDATRLQQIVWNLVSNAVKFTPSGGQVKIDLQRVGEEAQISFSDTGQGISPAFLPYVFDYFRQADSQTTRKFGGLGLGLAIVRHLVELHGGTVFAQSPGEGQGATFTVRLPLLKEEITPKNEATFTEVTQAEADILPLNDLDILVVDDDADTREFLTFLLEQFGAIITPLPSAMEALQVLAGAKPDVLLCDIGMPDMDGYMLIQQVRAWEVEAKEEPIFAIALTAYAGDSDRQKALKAGFQEHISKPIKPEALVKLLADLIHQRRQETEDRSQN